MNPIQDSLNDLRRASGVKSCLVVTKDGLVVAESLSTRFRSDIIAGLASYLAMTTNKALTEGGLEPFEQFALHAAHGKSVIVDLGESLLIVMMDQFADLDASRADIHGIAQRLRRSSQLKQ